MIDKKFEKLLKEYDWQGMAKAWAEGDLKWHKKEWKEFIALIRFHQREEFKKWLEYVEIDDVDVEEATYEVPTDPLIAADQAFNQANKMWREKTQSLMKKLDEIK